MHAVYTDFTKAFVRVNHKILLNTFHQLESYLTETKQTVRIQGFQPNEIELPSGVPQRSHLGPLFSIYS